MVNKEIIAAQFKALQSDICAAIEAADGSGKFVPEEWQREGGGGGITRVMQRGAVLEKAGVNFSAVHGQLPERTKKALKVNGDSFFACGVSIVMHPNSPMVPIIHMNVRYFEMETGEWWFGGGIDLTPHYVVEEDAKYFHSQLKSVCDNHNRDYYSKFKKWADDYFFIPHRNETRGIGGIFFDRLNGSPEEREKIFSFVLDVGKIFAPTYTNLIQKNKDLPFSILQKEWQLVRRGRYVEFNLVYDAGTRFGLETGGRIESILMSLPEYASWKYNFQVLPGSREEETLLFLKKDIGW